MEHDRNMIGEPQMLTFTRRPKQDCRKTIFQAFKLKKGIHGISHIWTNLRQRNKMARLPMTLDLTEFQTRRLFLVRRGLTAILSWYCSAPQLQHLLR